MFVEALAHQLKLEAGLDAWWFQGKQLPGEEYRSAIIEHIVTAQAVIVIVSVNSASSMSVLNEVALARKEHKRLIPIVIGEELVGSLTEDMRRTPVVYELRNLDMINGRGGRNPLPKLLQVLRHETEQLPNTESNSSQSNLSRLSKEYMLIEQVAQTNTNAVYRAREIAIDREVAIKVILPHYTHHENYIRLFEAEAHRVARLEHPHIVPLYRYWRDETGAYLVMRWMSGGSLIRALSNGLLPLSVVARYFAQLTNALAYAHHHGVIHRDIKPANILRDQNGNIYLSDFGIAQDFSNDPVEGYSIGYAPPEQIAGGARATPQTDIYSLGAVLFEMLTGTPVTNTTVLLQQSGNAPSIRAIRSDLPHSLDIAVQRALVPDPTLRYPDVASFAAEVRAAMHEALSATDMSIAAVHAVVQPLDLPDLPNPYKGLRAFTEADTADFFGREALTRRLVLRLSEGGPDARFLAVVGPSGSGKSSVVHAGLIPALRRGTIPGADAWIIATLTPGAQPLRNIAAMLNRLAPVPHATLEEQLQNDEHGLLQAVNQMLPPQKAVELLLVIDQFEELWTLVGDSTIRQHVLAALVAAVRNPQSRVRVLATLRADFYDRPLSHKLFGQLMTTRCEVVLPLNEAELEAAIVKPAEHVGVRVERALVREILADVEQQPGALPLLQYALADLFERRNGSILTLASYHDRGQVQGALARRADEMYMELTASQRVLVRQIFLRLVTPGEGTEDTRRRVQQSELTALEAHSASAATTTTQPAMATPAQTLATDVVLVLERYGQARLLTFDRELGSGEPTVEVAHEALIRVWGRLRAWLDEARDQVRTQRRLSEAATEWVRLERDQEYLAYGGPLAQFEELGRAGTLVLNPIEHTFIRESIAVRERAIVVERERQAHELAQAHMLARAERARAEEQAVAALRLRRRAIWLGAALALALVAVVVAGWLTGETRRQAELIFARTLVTRGEDIAGEQPALGLRLALEGLRIVPPNEQEERARTLSATVELARQGQGRKLVEGLTIDDVEGLSRSHDGSVFYLPGAGKPGELRDTRSNTVTPLTDVTNAVAFNPHGPWVGIAYNSIPGELRNLDTGAVIQLPKVADDIDPRSFSPDGTWVHIYYQDGSEELRNLQTGASIAGHIGTYFDWPTGHPWVWILVANENGPDQLRNLNTGQTLELVGQTDDADFNHDNTAVVLSYEDQPSEIRDLQNGAQIRLAGSVTRARFTPDGSGVVLMYDDYQEFRNLRTGNTIDLSANPVISPDRTWAVTDLENQPALLHLLSNTITPLASAVGKPFFSDDSTWLAIDYVNEHDEIHNLQNGKVTTFDGELRSVNFSPDSNWLVVEYSDKASELRHLQTGTVIGLGRERFMTAFSPDSTWLVVDGIAANNRPVQELRHLASGRVVQLSSYQEDEMEIVFNDTSSLVWLSSINSSEIWELGDQPRLLTKLQPGVTDVFFYPNDHYAVVMYDTGEVYQFDLAFLGALGGANGAPSEEELFSAACNGPLAPARWTAEDQMALTRALLGRRPSACPTEQ
jgi:WD40 repeat protein